MARFEELCIYLLIWTNMDLLYFSFLLLSVGESQQQRRLRGPVLYNFKIKKLLACGHLVGKKLIEKKN